MQRDMVDSGAEPRIDPATPNDTMAAGNLGMFLYTSAVQSSLLKASQGKFELRVAAMPAFADKPTKPTNSGSALFVFSKDPVKQRASFELLKFLPANTAIPSSPARSAICRCASISSMTRNIWANGPRPIR
jgi:multiple sugar transport system substrate-binding protein